MILEELANRLGVTFSNSKRFDCELASADNLMLCKPITYMNRSGGPVAELTHFYKISPDEVLIVVDDVALPLGKLRLRMSGSSGGHNGLQSVLDHLHTLEVARLRFGIGAAEGVTMTDHVLSVFAPEEKELLRQSITRVVDAIETAQREGADVAMNLFNQKT